MRALIKTETIKLKRYIPISLNILLYGILLILTFLIARAVYSSAVNKVPSYFGYSVVRIVSNSMEDTISKGDYILIRSTPVNEMNEGDIITFYSKDPQLKGAPNTHRIIKIEGEYFTTKGDANDIEDKHTVKYNEIIGKYQGKVNLGFIGDLFSNIWLFFILILIPLIFVIVHEIRKVIKLSITKTGDK